MLLHETDSNRGGAPMDQMLADCPNDWREEIFVSRRPVIPWLRVKEFKIVTLKMIVSSMLLHQSKIERKLQARSYKHIHAFRAAVRRSFDESVAAAAGTGAALSDSSRRDLAGAAAPCAAIARFRRSTDTVVCMNRVRSVGKAPDLQTLGADLYVSGEVTRQKLSLPPAVLIISPENIGAASLAQEILKKYPENLCFEPPGMYLNNVEGGAVGALEHAGQTLSKRLLGHRFGSSRHHPDQRNRYFLLYLNKETWLGSTGSKLADQVRAARAAGIRVVLAHECDPTLGGCEFSSFFQTTPQDLIMEGLYARIAVAFLTGQHRAVSLCLLAREIGAVRRGIIKACVGGALTGLANAVHTNRSGSAGGGGAAGKNNAARCDRIADEEERRSRSRRSGRSGRSTDPEEEHTTADGPLEAPAPEAGGQDRNFFSQASGSAALRLSDGSRGVSQGVSDLVSRGCRTSFSGGVAIGPRARVTPAGDESDGESGTDLQASDLSALSQMQGVSGLCRI